MDDKDIPLVYWHTLEYKPSGSIALPTTSKEGIKLDNTEIVKNISHFQAVPFLINQEMLESHPETILVISKKELQFFEDFLESNALTEYFDTIAYVLARMPQVWSFASMYDNPEHMEGIPELRELKTKREYLINFLEGYMNSAKDGSFLHSISFKTTRDGTYSFKNFYINDAIMKAIVADLTGMHPNSFSNENVDNEEWKKSVRKKFGYVDSQENKEFFVSEVVVALKNFLVSISYLKDFSKGMPNPTAKLIVDFLEMGCFNIDGKQLDYQNVKNWYKSKIKP